MATLGRTAGEGGEALPASVCCGAWSDETRRQGAKIRGKGPRRSAKRLTRGTATRVTVQISGPVAAHVNVAVDRQLGSPSTKRFNASLRQCPRRIGVW